MAMTQTYSLQPPTPSSPPPSSLLQHSPYSERPHLLDLTTLDPESALLAEALTTLTLLLDNYALAPYTAIFNWSQVLSTLRDLAQSRGVPFRKSTFYIVAFRSQIPPTTVYAELGELDRAAHAEANASGGFLKYWFGTPDCEGRNLATCVWRTRKEAAAAGRGPAHRKASMATASMYSFWRIDRHALVIEDGVESWQIADWSD